MDGAQEPSAASAETSLAPKAEDSVKKLTFAEMQELRQRFGKEEGNPHNILDGCPPPTLAEVHPALIKYNGVYGSCTEQAIKGLEREAELVKKPAPLAFKEAARPSIDEGISLAANFKNDSDLPRPN